MSTVTDMFVRYLIELGIFANYNEYHAFEMGALLPVICILIAYLDRRVAAVTLSACVLAGFGFFPSLTTGTALSTKPWYFLGGLTLSSLTIFSSHWLLNKRSTELEILSRISNR